MPLTDSDDAAGDATPDREPANLVSITPFFIVRNLSASLAYYVERLGFELEFEGPPDDVYYARVSREGVGIMLKAITADVLPQPNHTRHAWARWDAYVYTINPDALSREFKVRGATFVKELSYIDDGLWGFEVSDADGYVLAFFTTRQPDGDVVLALLRDGSFSALAPFFMSSSTDEPRIVRLHRSGCFQHHPSEAAEALSCAAFLGAMDAMTYLLEVGIAPDGGSATGMNALHWAANRAQLATTRLLLDAGASKEARSAYGGTALGAAVWAAVHEPKSDHLAVIDLLLRRGAAVREAAFPSGSAAVDALLAQFGATNL